MTRIAQWLAAYYDAVLVVDESDVGPRAEDASRFVFGRLFTRFDHRLVLRLEELLERASAERWHVTASGSDSLFHSPYTGEAMALLARLQYGWLVDMRVAPSEADGIRERHMEALAEFPNLRRSWKRTAKASTEAVTMLRFLAMAPWKVLKTAHERRLQLDRLLVLTDRIPFVNRRDGRAFVDVEIPIPDWMRETPLDIDVLAVLDKAHPDVLPTMRLVGLVDSELWAVRRLAAARDSEGRTVDARYRSWNARGRPDEEVLTQELLDAALAGRREVREYLESILIPTIQRGDSIQVTDER